MNEHFLFAGERAEMEVSLDVKELEVNIVYPRCIDSIPHPEMYCVQARVCMCTLHTVHS